ncbi:MAG TPA: hypothetical protein VJZ16_06335, partial [Syntrophales bacterium]|nr:hypothetical protein [Syntrophales bacterium]
MIANIYLVLLLIISCVSVRRLRTRGRQINLRLMERFKKLRTKMVESQLRSRGIVDPRVLTAMEKIPRHLFVNEGM